jgi:hypothetical protein
VSVSYAKLPTRAVFPRQRKLNVAFSQGQLGLLAFANIELHAYDADNFAFLVGQRHGIWDDGNAPSVGPFEECLSTLNGSAFHQAKLGGAYVDWHQGAIRIIQSTKIGTLVFAELWGNTPQINSCLVAIRDATGCVRRVDGGWQGT